MWYIITGLLLCLTVAVAAALAAVMATFDPVEMTINPIEARAEARRKTKQILRPVCYVVESTGKLVLRIAAALVRTTAAIAQGVAVYVAEAYNRSR